MKNHVILDAASLLGASWEWLDPPADRLPGGNAYNVIKIKGAPGGSYFELGLEFVVPDTLYADKDFPIKLSATCREDPRFFSSRIVVVKAGAEGEGQCCVCGGGGGDLSPPLSPLLSPLLSPHPVQPHRSQTSRHAHAGSRGQPRPEYYRVPGRKFDSKIIRVPEGQESTIYFLAVPTPPFDVEEAAPFTTNTSPSLLWPYKYRARQLSALPAGAQAETPIVMSSADSMLTPTKDAEGNGFLFDCFDGQKPAGALSDTGTAPAPTPSSTVRGNAECWDDAFHKQQTRNDATWCTCLASGAYEQWVSANEVAASERGCDICRSGWAGPGAGPGSCPVPPRPSLPALPRRRTHRRFCWVVPP